MSPFQAIFLGLIQGVTEFLPISSSGHLVVTQSLLSFSTPPVAFDVLVHLATLLAVVVYFRHQLLALKPQMLWFMLIATIPAAIAGYFFKEVIDQIFSSMLMVGIGWLITALFVFSTKKSVIMSSKTPLTAQRSFIIGLWQMVAILPGISRSGTTISAGLHQKLDSTTAFNFSFLIAIPAIVGASLLNLPEISHGFNGHPFVYSLGFIVAAFSGYASLHLVNQTIQSKSFYRFSYYCFIIGISTIFISLF